VIRYNVVLSVRYNKTTQEGKYHTNTVILYKRAYTSIFTVCLYWFYIVGPDYLCHNYYYCLIVVYLLYFTDTEKLCKYNDMMFLLTKDEKNGINIKASRMMGNIIWLIGTRIINYMRTNTKHKKSWHMWKRNCLTFRSTWVHSWFLVGFVLLDL
jgi:hypothetical protein